MIVIFCLKNFKLFPSSSLNSKHGLITIFPNHQPCYPTFFLSTFFKKVSVTAQLHNSRQDTWWFLQRLFLWHSGLISYYIFLSTTLVELYTHANQLAENRQKTILIQMVNFILRKTQCSSWHIQPTMLRLWYFNDWIYKMQIIN